MIKSISLIILFASSLEAAIPQLRNPGWIVRGSGQSGAGGGGGGFAEDAVSGTNFLSRITGTNIHTFGSGANRTAIIGISWDSTSAPGVASVTVGGVSATEIWDQECADCGTGLSAAYVISNPASGPQEVVFTFTTAAADTISIGVISFIGGNTASPNRTPATAFAFNATPTVTAPSAVAGDIVVDVFTLMNTGGITVGASQTSRYEDDQVLSSGMAQGMSTQNGADGGVMSWTIVAGGNRCWVTGAVAMKPAP